MKEIKECCGIVGLISEFSESFERTDWYQEHNKHNKRNNCPLFGELQTLSLYPLYIVKRIFSKNHCC